MPRAATSISGIVLAVSLLASSPASAQAPVPEPKTAEERIEALSRTGRFEQAAEIAGQQAAHARLRLGRAAKDVAAELNSQAEMLIRQARYGEAKAKAEEAHRIVKEAGGARAHPAYWAPFVVVAGE